MKFQKLAQDASCGNYSAVQILTENLLRQGLTNRVLTEAQLQRTLGGSPSVRYGLVNRALKANSSAFDAAFTRYRRVCGPSLSTPSVSLRPSFVVATFLLRPHCRTTAGFRSRCASSPVWCPAENQQRSSIRCSAALRFTLLRLIAATFANPSSAWTSSVNRAVFGNCVGERPVGGNVVGYYLRSKQGEIWLLTLYAKNVAESISGQILRKIKEEIDG